LKRGATHPHLQQQPGPDEMAQQVLTDTTISFSASSLETEKAAFKLAHDPRNGSGS
jgi:hypothetical protein